MKNKFRGLAEDYKDELQPVNPAEFAYVSYPKNFSLDQLVDRYLVQYEQEAIGKGTPKIHENSWKEEFGKFLNEAAPDADQLGGDIGLDSGTDDAGMGLGAPDMGAGAAAPEQPAGPNVLPPDIDIERFTELLYGLMQNYETLIDPKTTIMNRAEEYVAKNYSPRHAEKLVKFLETKYGIGFKQRATNSDEFYAAGAFGDAGSSTVSATPT